MFRINTITEDAAEGRVKAVFDEIRESLGIVPNVFKVLSLWSEGLELYAAMFTTMIAATVSRNNQCDYCLGHHKNFMIQYGISSEISEQIVSEPQTAEIPDGEKLLLSYVKKVTLHAYKVTDRDVEVLKEGGWTHEQILEATLIASLFNAINRFADALGVKPEA